MKYVIGILLFYLTTLAGLSPRTVSAQFVQPCDTTTTDLRTASDASCIPDQYTGDPTVSTLGKRFCSQTGGAACPGGSIFCKSGHQNINFGKISCYSSGVTTEDPTCLPPNLVPGLPTDAQLDSGLFPGDPCRYKSSGWPWTEYAKLPKDYCSTLGYKFAAGKCVPTAGAGMISRQTYLCPKSGCDTALGPIPSDPAQLLTFILGLIISLTGGVFVLGLIRAGYLLLTSTGDPQKLGEAKELATSVIIGFVMIFLSFVLLQTVGVNILNIPGLSGSVRGPAFVRPPGP